MLSRPSKLKGKLDQRKYEEYIKRINFKLVNCSCGKKGLIKHGYYKRSIKLNGTLIILYILRVKCKECGKTHAILHPLIVPYSRVVVSEMIEIIKEKEKGFSFFYICNKYYNNQILESSIRIIIKNFKKYWKDKLEIIGINIIKIKLETMLEQIAKQFKQAFMQIKKKKYMII